MEQLELALFEEKEVIDLVEEKEKRKMINGDNLTAEEVVYQFEKLIHRFSHTFSRAGREVGLEKEDIFSIGMEALIISYEKFDPSLNIRFLTYAIPSIRGRILEEINKQSTVCRFSRGLKQTANKIYNDDNERLPYEELSKIYNVTVREIKGALTYLDQNRSRMSLEDTVNDRTGMDMSISEVVGFEEDNSQLDVERFLSTLTEVQRDIVLMSYAHNKHTQLEIARKHNISQSKVSREIKIIQELCKEYFNYKDIN